MVLPNIARMPTTIWQNARRRAGKIFDRVIHMKSVKSIVSRVL